MSDSAVLDRPVKVRKPMSQAQRDAARDRLEKGREKQRQAKAEAQARGEVYKSPQKREHPAGMCGIDALAKAVNVPATQLAKWTREGLIPCLRVAQLRSYSVDAVKAAIQKLGSCRAANGGPLAI